ELPPGKFAVSPERQISITADTSLNTESGRPSRNFSYIAQENPWGCPSSVRETVTNRSGCGIGSRASISALTTLKVALLAPIPSASVSAAMVVNPGFLLRKRSPYRMSRDRLSTGLICCHQVIFHLSCIAQGRSKWVRQFLVRNLI